MSAIAPQAAISSSSQCGQAYDKDKLASDRTRLKANFRDGKIAELVLPPIPC